MPDPFSFILVLIGAFVAGFTSGFAGFGTGLVASGLWFHALPAQMVPPLVAFASVASQALGLFALRKAFNWRRAVPFLVGGVIGVPVGVYTLAQASPDALKSVIGAFLIVYALLQLSGVARLVRLSWRSQGVDGLVGASGGFLGGFAGLSGPLPLIWLQMRGGSTDMQRAVYQPFNLIVLTLAGIGMIVSGQAGGDVATLALACLPATLAGTWIGLRLYRGAGEATFQRVVLVLLLLSGLVLVAQMVIAT